MSKTIFKTGLSLLAAVGLVWPAAAALTGGKSLTGHVPSVVSHLSSTGTLDDTNVLHLTIGLPLHHQDDLTALMQRLYDPTSSDYHHYLTPDQFTERFGPTEQEYQSIISFAQTNGFTVTHTHGNRMIVDVDAKVSDLNRAFHITMRKYHHPTEARDFYSPDTEPSVGTNLPILHVAGMNNYILPRPMYYKITPGAAPGNGSGLGGTYIGSDFRNAYVPGSSLNGSNQVVGLLQFDGYLASDIQEYESLAGMTNVPLQNVLLDGFNGAPASPQGSGEVSLDIEMSVSMAPALAQVVVFEAGPFGNPDDILSAMASSNQIKQLSSSWGYDSDAISDQLYQQFAIQGQTYLNCSGDGDAWVGGILYPSVEDPYVTVVGGTTLTMHGNGSSYSKERAWNAGNVGDFGWNPDGYAGTSGGISTDVNIPAWQQGINMTTNMGSTTMRNVPDIALTADNVFLVADGGEEQDVGGTSCATPLWAGFMALVNQQAAANNDASVGFLAPTVYALAKTASYTNIFHDITAGSNTWDQSPNLFYAVPGYDLCTGWGTPNGTNMINALAPASGSSTTPPIVISAPLPPWGTTLSALDGGNPNGDWFLFIQDDVPLYSGMISNGWSMTLTTATPVGPDADNQVYMTPTNPIVTVGSYWNLTVAVTNYGPSFSTNVEVTDTFPLGSGVSVATNTVSVGSVTQDGEYISWTVGNLSANAGGVMNLSLYVSGIGALTNTATVTSGTTDPNPDDDTASVVVSSQPSVPPSLAAAGFGLTGHGGFEISVTGNAVPTAIEGSTNLATGNWVYLYTNTPPFTFTNIASTNYPAQFYRAVTLP